ncbi:thylakoid lumenal 15.0 kDa protein 2, chloroplastic isoform X2 [Raphanus sativus]|uniref:Thylakoid lumenal 15.0 kDa protein 2, chloroplastic isoform X2 n=1 Tax=Raphanus sativus TaxID=3726 RepID=A0A6J0M9B1_RAPSA|nr:thylakoid lumenal 15.0 kDa protein 2, chloroplastic isoform X2 [Raphanus sativus]
MAILFRPPQCRAFSLPVFNNHATGETTPSPNSVKLKKSGAESWSSRFRSKSLSLVFSGALALGLSLSGGVGVAEAAKVGVNKPELLPKEFTSVIDVAGFLSDGQEKRIAEEIDDIEKDTGFKLRVLAQNYPVTPGNILNFNVGATVDLDIPRSFWSRLAGKYGNMFYWKEKGEDASIEAAVMAISSCLREPVGANNCAEIY